MSENVDHQITLDGIVHTDDGRDQIDIIETPRTPLETNFNEQH